MTTAITDAEAPARAATLTAGLLAFGFLELGLGVFQAAAPHAFFTAIGPFGAYNAHYSRDVATFELALGAGLLLAASRPAWRVPVLALACMQFALHALNHLLDIGAAHPRWTGYFDFLSLASATVMLLWLLRVASAEVPPTAIRAESQR
jgi:hypothetical protein